MHAAVAQKSREGTWQAKATNQMILMFYLVSVRIFWKTEGSPQSRHFERSQPTKLFLLFFLLLLIRIFKLWLLDRIHIKTHTHLPDIEEKNPHWEEEEGEGEEQKEEFCWQVFC